MTMVRTAPSKLCRRTYFLQSGTAPSISEMRNELGPELADIIIATLQPSQRTAVQPDRLVVVSGESALAGGGGGEYDAERVRGDIHEHILRLGGSISQRVQGYWRERLRTAATAVGSSSDDVDFLRFECRQKVSIARDEERRRYDALLREMEETMRRRFWEEKGELHRSYAKARALWGEFVCRKVRKQAKDMLCKIAARFRTQLEQEVNRRMQVEKTRIVREMEHIVKTAVDQQKRIDERAMQWMIYQYEELLKFINEYDGCLQVVEMTRELCNIHANPRECRSTQVSNCSTPNADRPLEVGATSSTSHKHSIRSLELADDVEFPSTDLAQCNVFIVSQCLPGPEPDPAREEARSSIELPLEPSTDLAAGVGEEITFDEDSERSSIEKIVIGGLTYAQPKYYNKTYNELFGDVTLRWERIDPEERSVVADNIPDAVATGPCSSDASSICHEDCSESQPSYRESYDPIVEISETLLPSMERVSVVEDGQGAEFGVLFDPAKSESELAEVADRFALRYIRATSSDFELMFPKEGNVE
uniref:Uncharacterized protein n=1 Tax=Anopheles atroparvus TaxID=41427 RepID=A0A182J344_ANOAO